MMAGWFPDRGCDDFFAALWQEPAIRRELERRLGGHLGLVAGMAE